MNLTKQIGNIFQIRQGEGFSIVLLFSHAFFMGIVNVSFETTANTLFLTKFDVEILPIIYIATSFISVGMGIVYSRFEESCEPRKLLFGNLIFIFFSLVGFYLLLLLSDSRWVALGLMIWKDIIYILASIELWAVCGFLFNIRQGKRLFGLIGAGEILAIILGGFSVSYLVKTIGVSSLILLSVGGQFVSLIIFYFIVKNFGEQFNESTEDEPEEKESESIPQLFKNRYIFLFFIVSALSQFSFYFVDYIFYAQVEQGFPDENRLASFFGVFFGVLGIVNLLLNTFASGPLLTKFGLSVGLLGYPIIIALGIGSAVVAFSAFGGTGLFLWVIIVTKLIDEAMSKSFESPTFRIISQPLRVDQQMRVQMVRESITEPAAVGMAGLVLYILNTVFSVSVLTLCFIVLLILAGWCVSSINLRKKYTEVLTEAIGHRRLKDVGFDLNDGTTLKSLEKGLESSISVEIIYSVSILSEIGHPKLESILLNLLNHNDPLVREHVLLELQSKGLTATASEVIKLIKNELDPKIKSAALYTLCVLVETEAFDAVSPYLDDSDWEIRQGAMVGLLRHGGIQGVVIAGTMFNELLKSDNSEERKFAARVLGKVGVSNFYQPLVNLLQDDDMSVRKAALEAASELKNPRLSSLLIENLSVQAVSGAARSSLIAFGDIALPNLISTFEKKDADYFLKSNILEICANIHTQKCIEFLESLIDYPGEDFRGRVLSGLVSCGYTALGNDQNRIKERIVFEAKNAAWALSCYIDLMGDAALTEISSSLNQEIVDSKERILSLISLIHKREVVANLKLLFQSDSSNKRANALELLDNILDQEIKNAIFPLFEDLSHEEQWDRIKKQFPYKKVSSEERLRMLIVRPKEEGSNWWTKACCLYFIGQRQNKSFEKEVASVLKDSDPLINETAVWALSRLGKSLA